MKLNFACKSCGRSRVARVESCHWSEGYVGVSLQERRATMQVMLGMGRNSSNNNNNNNNKSIYIAPWFQLTLFKVTVTIKK